MRKVFRGALIGAAMVALAGGQAVPQEPANAQLLNDLETVRLHFATFSKSKSGAT